MKLTEVLLVTQNSRDQGEINFVSTMDEFIKEHCAGDSPEIGDMIRCVVNSALPYQWDGFSAAEGNKTFEMRFCQSQEDLLQFLDGKFNDSIEKMENRLPGTSGIYSSWNWHNSPEMFSERAVRIIKDYARGLGNDRRRFVSDLLTTMPDFPTEKGLLKARRPHLTDLIKQAEARNAFPRVSSPAFSRGNSLEI